MRCRRIISAVAAAFMSSAAALCQSFDTTAVDSMVARYLKAVDSESTEVKNGECDFMLESCDSGALRNRIAVRLYSHFISSKLMGDEGVAVHLADKWFSTGRASFSNSLDLMNARIFADFNRQSLIGCRAPSLSLVRPDGSSAEALGTAADSAEYADGRRRLRILYFYDTDCAKCRVETPLLRKMLDDRKPDAELIAVYCGTSPQAWESYRKHLEAVAPVSVNHYWDPEAASGFHMKYGVMQTPKMFLIGRDGRIIGRGLDTEALAILMAIDEDSRKVEYGSEEAMELFEKILSGMPADSIRTVADYIEHRTLGEGRDTVNFRRLTGDMYYYLTSEPSEENIAASGYVAGNKILSRPEIWNSKNDSLMIIGYANMMQELFERIPEGERLPSIKLAGTMNGKVKVKDLSKLRDMTVIFHSPACNNCKANIEAAKRMKLRTFLIDVDALRKNDNGLSIRVLDTFDLTTLPFVVRTDKKGRVARKYIDLTKEESIAGR